MKAVPQMKAVMTPFPHAVDAMEDVNVARAMFEQYGIRHLPVLQDGELRGILSERDLQLAQGLMAFRKEELSLPVWAVCNRDPYRVDMETTVDHVVDAMANRQIGSVLVTREGKLAGIFTTTDACRLLAKRMREDAGANRENIVA